MKLRESHITLSRLRFHARHGVLEQERTVGNDYEVTVRIGFDASRAMATDDVADTIDYGELCRLVGRVMAEPCRLLERVAARMGEAITERFDGIRSLDISVTKLNPPMGADCDGATVEIHLTADPQDSLNK